MVNFEAQTQGEFLSAARLRAVMDWFLTNVPGFHPDHGQALQLAHNVLARADGVYRFENPPQISALLENLRDAHAAMRLIRTVVEELGPVGCMRSGEEVTCADAPTFDAEAKEIIRGIRRIAEVQIDVLTQSALQEHVKLLKDPLFVAQEPLLQFFNYDHLKPELQAISKPFAVLAVRLTATLAHNPERTAAMRKLLEAKDAAVRSSLYT